jgi:membrane protein
LHRRVKDQVTRVAKRFIADIGRDDAAGLAAELAYRFLFAIFPFGIFVAALTAFIAPMLGIDDPTGKILGSLGDNLPPDLANGIRPQLEAVIGKAQPGLLTFGAIIALWSATGGTNALIKAMNRAYEVEETRPLIPRYALAIGLTLLASVGIIAAFVTVVGASLLTTQVVQQLRLDQGVVDLVGLLRWPAVFIFLSIAVGVLYKLAPNIRVPFKWCVAGGAIFSIGWLVATAAFGFYVSNFANYANTYGALGGVIVLMLWFYISAFVLVAAAGLIAAALKELHPAAVEAAKPAPKEEKAEATDDDRAPEPRQVPAPRAVAPGMTGAATSLGRRQVTPEPPRRRPAAMAHRTSEPEDWAFAATVTALGASIGMFAAWLLRPRPRD